MNELSSNPTKVYAVVETLFFLLLGIALLTSVIRNGFQLWDIVKGSLFGLFGILFCANAVKSSYKLYKHNWRPLLAARWRRTPLLLAGIGIEIIAIAIFLAPPHG